MAREKQKGSRKDPLSKDIYYTCYCLYTDSNQTNCKNHYYHHHQGVLKHMFNANKKLLFLTVILWIC